MPIFHTKARVHIYMHVWTQALREICVVRLSVSVEGNGVCAVKPVPPWALSG